MTPGTRACLAYLVGREVLHVAAMSVYDHERSIDCRIGGTIRDDQVGLYDYERRCNFSGTLLHLRDDGSGATLVLNVDGFTFDGHDFSSGSDFSGWVNDWNIHVVDDAESRVFVYTLKGLESAVAVELDR